jgi:hypothetical protein
MIDDPQYRQQWKDKEKHSVKELDRFRGEPEVWGLEMKPLGDYVNGKIVPFPELQASQSQKESFVSNFSQATKTKTQKRKLELD